MLFLKISRLQRHMFLKRTALLCAAVICVAAFAIAYDYHDITGPRSDCAICFASKLSYTTTGCVFVAFQAQIAFSNPYQVSVALPEAPTPRSDSRAPPV